jgi:hypothetical protein
MPSKNAAPPIPTPLLEWLERLFQDTVPEEGAPPEDFYRKQGEQRIMRKLRSVHAQQNKPQYTE